MPISRILFRVIIFSNCSIEFLRHLQHLFSVGNVGLLSTSFPCSQSKFMQCCSVAPINHLFSGPVLALDKD